MKSMILADRASRRIQSNWLIYKKQLVRREHNNKAGERISCSGSSFKK